MEAIGALIGEFIGASIVNLPLTGLPAWGLFHLLKLVMPRQVAVFISCGVVGVPFLLLGLISGLWTRFQVYQLIAVAVWLIVGLIFWGKKKQPLPLPPPPNIV